MGGNERSLSQIDGFRSALDDCGLQDLGYEGPSFT